MSSGFYECVNLTGMDSSVYGAIYSIFFCIFIISTSITFSIFVCSKKKKPPPQPKSKSMKSNSNQLLSVPISQPPPNLPQPPILQTSKAQGGGAAPAHGETKPQASDANKQKEPQSADNQNPSKKNVEASDKKPGIQEKKESESKPEDEKKGTKDGTKDPTKEPIDSKAPTPCSTKLPSKTPQPQPRGMEIHKSMKVRNKKKAAPTPAVASPSPATGILNNKTKVGDAKTKGTSKQKTVDGETTEDDDDETLRGVTSLKVDTKVPFSVDEPAP